MSYIKLCPQGGDPVPILYLIFEIILYENNMNTANSLQKNWKQFTSIQKETSLLGVVSLDYNLYVYIY